MNRDYPLPSDANNLNRKLQKTNSLELRVKAEEGLKQLLGT